MLGLVLVLRGGPRRLRLTRRQALGCALLGLMLPMLGNGMVSVGENLGAPSGVTALLIAVAPLMIVVFRVADRRSGDRPSAADLDRRAARLRGTRRRWCSAGTARAASRSAPR